MRAEKANGVNIDAKYGVEKVRDYLNARRLMDTAVGGGDLRANTVGLADAMRWLDLSRRGRVIAVSPHLLTVAPNDQPAEASAATLGDRKSAATRSNGDRVLNMLSGVTASAHKGTASGSCRVVFGSCPAQGLGGLAGKTGTADFAMAETSPLVKPGLQFPTKMFSAVFTSGGKRYAIGTMTLRVRQGSTDYLELTSSSAAELALTLIREALPLQTN
jgi:cell division protein FtsI/penicillin-binding protein 2